MTIRIGELSYAWEAFNHQYGPWYRLIQIKKGLRADMPGIEVLVQPDMDKGRWYWSVRRGAKNKRPKITWGKASSAEAARAAALEEFSKWY